MVKLNNKTKFYFLTVILAVLFIWGMMFTPRMRITSNIPRTALCGQLHSVEEFYGSRRRSYNQDQ
jgi:hypothetical protein